MAALSGHAELRERLRGCDSCARRGFHLSRRRYLVLLWRDSADWTAERLADRSERVRLEGDAKRNERKPDLLGRGPDMVRRRRVDAAGGQRWQRDFYAERS